MTTGSKQQKETTTPRNGKKAFSLISDEKLISLYTGMLKCRMLEERAQDLFKRGKLAAGYDSIAGREAAIVGVTIDLLEGDAMVASGHGLLPDFVKGLPTEEVFRRLMSSDGMSHRWPDPGYAALIATGVAMANKSHNDKKVAVTFQRGRSSASGAWKEALAFAGAHRLPILFVDSGTPQTRESAGKAEAHDFPCITADRNDVVAVYRVASEAISHARKGNGPTLIECMTYRLNESSSTRQGMHPYRRTEGGRSESDPLLNMERYLADKGLFGEGLKAGIRAAFTKDLEAAIGKAGKASLRGRLR